MKKFKLLLVDDEEEFVRALAERLKMRDLESDTVFDGDQALSFVDEKEPDVMVLDLKMPGIDGIEVLRRVRKTYPNLQVIILTGHGTEKDEERARRLGAFDYMRKPVDIDDLVGRVKKAYKRKLDDLSVAATFAEAGEFDTAREIMNEDDDGSGKR
ncbi:MAG: response regulator [Pseudomonadota bacterium]